MAYEAMVQSILDDIDLRIRESIRVEELARKANYSVHHFCRLFMAMTGTPVMSYVARRKLEYALYDLSHGERVTDVAMRYGFDTHAGFTKAFKKCYGYPPSLVRLHIAASLPEKATLHSVKRRVGGMKMSPHIIELTPFTVAGRTNRQNKPNVKRTADIPAFDFDPRADVHTLLKDTEKLFPNSKHCEVEMCYDVDLDTGEFIYFAGRGVTHPDDLKNIQPDMVRFEISGLYAIFSTEPVDQWQREQYAQTIRETWHHILAEWLPGSEFEYDEARKDFEYCDRRSHGWYFDGKNQMDIFIPIRQREEARRRSQEKGEIYWRHEMERRAKTQK